MPLLQLARVNGPFFPPVYLVYTHNPRGIGSGYVDAKCNPVYMVGFTADWVRDLGEVESLADCERLIAGCAELMGAKP